MLTKKRVNKIEQVNNFKNHGKIWTKNDYNKLDNYIKKKEQIDTEYVEQISNGLERKYDGIKYKILSEYINKEYDLLNIYKNEIIYNKYIFLDKKEIDNYVLNKTFITKKEKIYYNLIHISRIINDSNIIQNDKDKIQELINKINDIIDIKK
tara:strand:- start:264 stop:719 length:456 start_codon:yes stop_codon:yes gene_type:complete